MCGDEEEEVVNVPFVDFYMDLDMFKTLLVTNTTSITSCWNANGNVV